MYYSIPKSKRLYYRGIAILIVLSFFIIIHYTNSHAELLEENAENYRLKGYEEQQKGNFDLALTNYRKALSLGDKKPSIYNDMGVIYERLGIPDNAEQYYLQAISLNPDYLPPYTNLGYFYLANRNKNKAIYYFHERIRRAKEDDPWRKKIEDLLYEIDPDIRTKILQEKAEDLSQEIIQEAQDQFALEIARAAKHYEKGQIFFNDKQYDEAIREFNLGLIVTPDNPKLTEAIKKAENEKAINLLKERTEDAMEKLDAGDLNSAKQEFQEILATIPENSNHKSE